MGINWKRDCMTGYGDIAHLDKTKSIFFESQEEE